MVKRTFEQKIKSGNFRARNERNGIGAVFKNRREKCGGERKRTRRMPLMESSRDSVQKETAAASATMEVRVENQHQSRFLTLNCTKMVKSLRERRISEV